jgi:hypothetical protein
MCFIKSSGEIELLSAVAFTAVCFGVLIAVIGKAFGKFPYQPDEFKVFLGQRCRVGFQKST